MWPSGTTAALQTVVAVLQQTSSAVDGEDSGDDGGKRPPAPTASSTAAVGGPISNGGMPLVLSAKLAAHKVEEAQRYSASSSYELTDATASPLKLASPEWTQRDPVPPALSSTSSVDGMDLNLFTSRASN